MPQHALKEYAARFSFGLRRLNQTEVHSQTDQFSRRRHDKSLFESDIAQCVIPAKLVLDLIGERESTHPPHYWIPAFAGMTRGAGQFEYIIDPFEILDTTGELPVILMEIEPASGNIMKTYIHANGQVLAQHNGPHTAAKYFYLHDRLGSVRQIINTSGLVQKYYTYEPFGQTIESGGTLDNPFRFTGQYFDSEIEEYYLRARAGVDPS